MVFSCSWFEAAGVGEVMAEAWRKIKLERVARFDNVGKSPTLNRNGR